MRNCQEGKVKSREMEHSGETRQLVSIQSEKVLEVKNLEHQMGSKHKSQSGIPMLTKTLYYFVIENMKLFSKETFN